jgi:hypothetical protein
MTLTIVDHENNTREFCGTERDILWLFVNINTRVPLQSVIFTDIDGSQVFPALKIDYVFRSTNPVGPIFGTDEAKLLYKKVTPP